jgi:hypothetical protein
VAVSGWVRILCGWFGGESTGVNYHIEQSSLRRGSGGSMIVYCLCTRSSSVVTVKGNAMKLEKSGAYRAIAASGITEIHSIVEEL